MDDRHVLHGAAPTVTNYTYTAGNQLTNAGAATLTYDNNGNLTSDGTNAHTWDRANRLLSMGSATYAYDGAGNLWGLLELSGLESG